MINPYTFVPLVPDPVRAARRGHDRAGDDGLSGELLLTITAATPLLVSGFPDGQGQVADVPRHAVTGEVILPGSGLLGAIRSVHEALAGGCLRVLDPDYAPVHRHAMLQSELSGVGFGVVAEVDADGLPSRILPCGNVIRIHHELLAAHPRGPLCTGDVLDLPEAAVEERNGRRLLSPERRRDGQVTGVAPDTVTVRGSWTGIDGVGWVLLVTDTAARNKKLNPQGRRPPAYFAAGKVTGSALTVPRQTREVLRDCLDGAEDLRRGRRHTGLLPAAGTAGTAGAMTVPVRWPGADDPEDGGPVVGRRLKVDRRVYVGQPVWFRSTADGTGPGPVVTEIRLSQLWRYRGGPPLADRIGTAGPCTDPGDLCPSCRVFGSAGRDARDESAGSRQRSYRGHVRIDDATPAGQISLREGWDLAPLAAPKPSAGQFYLDHDQIPVPDRLTTNEQKPGFVWGSPLDRRPGGPRRVRGRKFYWRTTSPLDEPARGHRRDHHDDSLTRGRVTLIDAGAVFTTRLRLDNLSPAQVGGLVAAIDPRRVWPEHDVVTSVGGGRPFGFGSARVEISVARLERPRARYLGLRQEVPTLTDCVARFTGTDPDRSDDSAGRGDSAGHEDPDVVSSACRASWPDLRAALTFGRVPDAQVWYPAGPGPKGGEDFDHAYEFFARTRGQSVSVVGGQVEDRPIVALARPHDPAGSQPIEPKVTRRQGEGR